MTNQARMSDKIVTITDQATKELMANFYGEMVTNRLSSLADPRRAQMRMLNDPRFKAPFYWAAFTPQGDPVNSPELPRPSNRQIGALFKLLLGLAVYWSLRIIRRRARK